MSFNPIEPVAHEAREEPVTPLEVSVTKRLGRLIPYSFRNNDIDAWHSPSLPCGHILSLCGGYCLWVRST